VNILIACEFSGIVREAFTKPGDNVWSCDLLPSEIPGQHYQGDMFDIVGREWDMLIAFPPCTCLSIASAWKYKGTSEREKALEFIRRIMVLDIPRIAIENPIGAINTAIRKPDQIIEPYWFGHGYTKATCLWLKNLPPLKATNFVPAPRKPLHDQPDGKNRWKIRSRTFPGVASAMASQWR
jgi:site-specific DNA-cytosine methylase